MHQAGLDKKPWACCICLDRGVEPEQELRVSEGCNLLFMTLQPTRRLSLCDVPLHCIWQHPKNLKTVVEVHCSFKSSAALMRE
eukprot:1725897-Amphidinium_carterae.1